MADEREPVGQGPRADDGPFEGPLAHQRAHVQAPVHLLDGIEAAQTVEVDDHRRGGQAQVQHGHEALAAGQGPGLVAVLPQQAERLFQLGRALVAEPGRLHPVTGREPRPGPG